MISINMQSRSLLEKIGTLQKSVFTLTDLEKITGKKREYLKVYLFRLKKRGVLYEAERGKYILPRQHPFITASHLLFPSYISFLSAYSYYQITTQIPRTITVVAVHSKQSISLDNYTVKFVRFQPSRIFGFRKEKFMEKEVFVAEKEKAIIDSLYLPEYCSLEDTYFALGEGAPNPDKLIDYALRMDSAVLLKRLGYLLDLQGIDIYEKVKKSISSRYDVLDPTSKVVRTKSKKWRLIINKVLRNVE